MKSFSRRNFIKSSLKSTAALSLAGSIMFKHNRVLGANGDIRIGIIGLRSKGSDNANQFRKIPGVRIVALCDVDQDILDREVTKARDLGETITPYRDARDLLDNQDIDAVVIATPNHWHSLLTIWACQTGKDVYVEKPVSHNVWEGRKMVEAARKYDRIVQAGTQNRSDVGFRDAVEYIHAGELGDIQWIHGLWYKQRPGLGYVDKPLDIPKNIDFDLWVGPAAKDPIMRPSLHYDWHWFWNTGNGDLGNLGVHQLDDCRFASRLQGLPRQAICFGGRLGVKDFAQTPNTIFSYYDYEKFPIMVEIRNLPMAKGVNAMDHLRGVRMGNIIQCENGYFAGGRGGGWSYDNDHKKLKQFPGDGGDGHMANFIDAVRSRKRETLHAEVEECHISSALCHMGNTSYRIGSDAAFGNISAELPKLEHITDTIERIHTHLNKNEINLSYTPLTLGPWLTLDDSTEQYTGEFADQANQHLRRAHYRKPFVVPDTV